MIDALLSFLFIYKLVEAVEELFLIMDYGIGIVGSCDLLLTYLLRRVFVILKLVLRKSLAVLCGLCWFFIRGIILFCFVYILVILFFLIVEDKDRLIL
jgi:hypothetical protein